MTLNMLRVLYWGNPFKTVFCRLVRCPLVGACESDQSYFDLCDVNRCMWCRRPL